MDNNFESKRCKCSVIAFHVNTLHALGLIILVAAMASIRLAPPEPFHFDFSNETSGLVGDVVLSSFALRQACHRKFGPENVGPVFLVPTNHFFQKWSPPPPPL